MQRILSLLFLITLVSQASLAQEYYDDQHLRYDDYAYDNQLKSINLYKAGFEMSMPFLELNSEDQLMLSFDDIAARSLDYQFTVELCNADWTPSELMQMEYLEGVYEEYLSQGEASINTTQLYQHYRALVPGDNMRITKSGNYLLKVSLADEPEQIVFTRRFYVYESSAGINATVDLPRNVQSEIAQHEMFLEVDLSAHNVQNVYTDLLVIVEQNGRKDNRKILTQPKSANGNTLKYNILKDIMFEAGNEYRGLDFRSIKMPVPQIYKTYKDSSGLNILLRKDPNRQRSSYITYEDLNGQYQVINRDPVIRSSHIESEYAWVHFRLPATYPYSQGAIYILGAYNNWAFNDDNKMVYNYDTQSYEGKLYLKQGFYNYMYAYLPNGKETAELFTFEGSHPQARNQYNIYVYDRSGSTINERLIAIETIESKF